MFTLIHPLLSSTFACFLFLSCHSNWKGNDENSFIRTFSSFVLRMNVVSVANMALECYVYCAIECRRSGRSLRMWCCFNIFFIQCSFADLHISFWKQKLRIVLERTTQTKHSHKGNFSLILCLSFSLSLSAICIVLWIYYILIDATTLVFKRKMNERLAENKTICLKA